MKTSIQVQVKNPCKENFEHFKSTPKGGFCQSCKKEVIDFSKMSNEQLIRFLSSHTKKVCGRLRKSQLDRPSKPTLPFFRQGIGLATLTFVIMTTAPTVQGQTSGNSNNSNLEQVIQKQFTVKGNVFDDQNLPLAGANVVLKGSNEGVVTDLDGNFEFSRALNAGDVLVFSYLGYDPKEYKIQESESPTQEIIIQFEASDVILMGEVSVDELYSSKGKLPKKSRSKRKK